MLDIALTVFLCAAAWLFHFTEKWADHRKAEPVGLQAFLLLTPAQHLSSLLAAVVAFVVCLSMEWMNPMAAVACGYMGDSVTRRVAGKFTV